MKNTIQLYVIWYSYITYIHDIVFAVYYIYMIVRGELQMDISVYEYHYKEIKNLVNTLGVDEADDLLKKELSHISKAVMHTREKISNMKHTINSTTNSDELLHLKYDIEDTTNLLNTLLGNLKTADERYLCFEKYLANLQNFWENSLD